MFIRLFHASMALHRSALLALVMVLAMPAHAQLFRWVDEAGRVTYSTSPQPGTVIPNDQERRAPSRSLRDDPRTMTAQPQQVVTPRSNPSGPRAVEAAPLDQDGHRRTVTVPPLQVTVYATSWCAYCARTRAFFRTYRVAFQELDIEKSTAAHAAFKKLGGGGVPLIVIDGRVIHGFDEAKLAVALGLR